MTNQRSSARRAEHCALHPVGRRFGSMMMSSKSHMHDNKPNADLGKGSIDGSGEEFYALGERLETDDNDTYDNYGTNIYGNGKMSKYEDLQFLHDDSFQENFVNITQTSFFGAKSRS